MLVGASLLYAAVSAYTLPHVARRARELALGQLMTQLRKLRGRSDQAELQAQLEGLKTEVESLQDGAFGRLDQQPVVRAGLALLGSLGGASLLDYLRALGW